MDKLVGQNPRDELILEIESMRSEQEILHKEAKEKYIQERLVRERMCKNARIEKRKKVFESAFWELAQKYLGLEDQFLERLGFDKQKVQELEKIVFTKAKRSLWWKMPLVLIFGLGIPIFGWALLPPALLKSKPDFPSYKFVTLYKWYKDNFGPIPLMRHFWH